MTARPIIFSAESVLALLAGRKTQSRRIACSGRGELGSFRDGVATFWDSIPDDPAPCRVRCRYGAPGDVLWVKETWAPVDFLDLGYELKEPVAIGYRATETAISYQRDNVHELDVRHWGWDLIRWRSPIFMPRWASRLELDVLEVRVERLQKCSEADAEAEGVAPFEVLEPGEGRFLEPFADRWDVINGKLATWASNPWVFVLRFQARAR